MLISGRLAFRRRDSELAERDRGRKQRGLRIRLVRLRCPDAPGIVDEKDLDSVISLGDLPGRIDAPVFLIWPVRRFGRAQSSRNDDPISMIARSEFQEHPWENFAWFLKVPGHLDLESLLGEFVRRLRDAGERRACSHLDGFTGTETRGRQCLCSLPLSEQRQFI